MKRMDVGELNNLYNEAEAVDRSLFAEQRSNILLIAGDHYSKRGVQNFSKLRNNRDVMNKVNKLRLTKNHSIKIHRYYVTSVLQFANGVKVQPQLEHEVQDQKAAELSQAVWDDIKRKSNYKEKVRRWASDFCGVGEVHVKVFWNPYAGKLKGYEQLLDSEGFPVFDEMGQPLPDNNSPVFEGKFEYERVFGFNLLRDPSVKELEDSPYLIVRKLANTKELMAKYGKDESIKKDLADGANEEYVVFDAANKGFDRAKGKTPIREYYYRPCFEYPNGYFYITTKGSILEEGELPYGVFPIRSKLFHENQTSPRGQSIQKQVRPYQAEINRASSAQATHQITIGDDKILYQSGTKLSPGSMLPGVRGIQYQGQQPAILAGRDGAQYQGYIKDQISELYDVTDAHNMFEMGKEVKGGNDMMALLFRSAAQRQALSIYSQKFEEFLVDICETTLRLAKEYLSEDLLIPAIGMREYVNISEFKNTQDINYQVKVVPQDDTLETQFGKQLTFQHLMQYTGQNLSKQDIGMLMRSMPYANAEEQFKEYTLDYDNVKNMILALDRGEYPESILDDNHEYVIQKLTARMRQADFRFLDPQIQQAYAQKRQEHQAMNEERKQRLIAEQAEYIPADGPMVACDMYIENPEDPTKAPKRARIPQNALNWLVQMLERQSGPLTQLEQQSLGNLQDMEALGGMQQPQGMLPGAAMPGMFNM